MTGYRPITRFSSPCGLTLVELLIAAMMLSILFVGVGGHLRGGVEVWRRATETVERLQRRRVGLDRLERDLANAVAYTASTVEGSERVAPKFHEHDAQWWSVIPAAAWPSGIVRLVNYRCESVDGVPGLWRTSQSLGELLAETEPAPTPLLPNCATLAFRYAYLPAIEGAPLEWSATWEEPGELPRFMEVSLRVDDDDVRRVMSIPIGALKQRTPE